MLLDKYFGSGRRLIPIGWKILRIIHFAKIICFYYVQTKHKNIKKNEVNKS